ncbi:MAG: hypothetical protein LWX51_11350, partial [Deltaproteobacteria bacterium]|nr:hypothetical protein [Deltaproteobacteria bacterium]
DFYENTYGYCITNKSVKREHRIPQVLYLEDDVVVSVLRREKSPWTLKVEDNDLNLYYWEKYERTLSLPDPLPFFGKSLSNGSMSDDVISVNGAVTPGFFIYSHCYYFTEGVPCGFCSLKHARKTVGKNLVPRFSEIQVKESIEYIQSSSWGEIPLYSNTTGTPRTDRETQREIIDRVRWMSEAQDPKRPIHILTHPPHDFKLLDEFKEAGVTSIGLNMEVYDRMRFKEICPGKDKFYGYDKWWDCLEYAREVFGDFRVYCGLVWGLEPVESTMEGMVKIMKRGVGLSTNIFHADPGSVLVKKEQPSVEDIMKLSKFESDLFLQFPTFKTIYDVSMRNTLDWEIHQGFLRGDRPEEKNMESTQA